MKTRRRPAVPTRSTEDKDWLWPLLAVSAALHLIVFLLFPNGFISTPDTFVIRSMTFMHEDTVTPIRVASAPRAPVPVGKAKAELTPAPPRAEETEIVPVPAESHKPVLKEENKLQLAESLVKRPFTT